MFKNKQQVDQHVARILSKIRDQNERQLKGYQLAKLYVEVKDYNSAKRFIDGYLSIKDQHATAYTLKGEILDALGDQLGALKSLKRSYEIDNGQKSLVLKICDLYSRTSGHNPAHIRFWVDICEKLHPSNPVLFKLKEQLLSDTPGGNDGLENLLISEVKTNPTDSALSVKLLRFLLDIGKTDDAYKYCVIPKNYEFHRDSLTWFSCVVDIFEEVQRRSSVAVDALFEQFYLLALCGQIRLSLSKRTLAELDPLFARFDGAISAANSCPMPLLDEMTAQLFFFAGVMLQRKLDKSGQHNEEYQSAIHQAYLISYSYPLVSLPSSTLPCQHTLWNLVRVESTLRRSQSGHLAQILDSRVSPSRPQRNLARLIYQSVDTEALVEQEESLLIFKNDKRLFAPELEELQDLDIEVIMSNQKNLPLLMWILLHYDRLPKSIFEIPQENNGINFFLTVLSSLFPQLPLTNTNTPATSEITPESLGRLDLLCFLVATLTYTQARFLIDSDRRHTRREEVAIPLCLMESLFMPTGDHKKFWAVVNDLTSSTGTSLGRNRAILQRGMNQLRSCERLPLPVLLRISYSLSSVSQECAGPEKSVCANWQDHYWKMCADRLDLATLPPAKRQINTSSAASTLLSSPASYKNSRADALFPLSEEELGQPPLDLLSEWRELGLSERAELAASRGELSASVDILDGVRSASTLRRQAELVMQAIRSENTSSGDTEMAMITQAKDYLLKALDQCDGIRDITEKQAMNAAIARDLELVNDTQRELLSRTGTNIDSSISFTPGGRQPSSYNNFQMSRPAGSLFNGASRFQSPPCGTPRQAEEYGSVPPVFNRSVSGGPARLTPERMDAQLRYLSTSQESIVAHLFEQNKSLLQSNTKLNQLFQDTNQRLESLTSEFNRSCHINSELKVQLASIENKVKELATSQKNSAMNAQQQQQLYSAQVGSLPLQALYSVNSPYMNAATAAANPQLLQNLQLAALQQQQQLSTLQRVGQIPVRYPVDQTGNIITQPTAHDKKSGVPPGFNATKVGKAVPEHEEEGEEGYEGDEDYFFYEDEYETGLTVADGGWPYGQRDTNLPVVAGAASRAAPHGKQMPQPGFFQSPGQHHKEPTGSDAFTVGSRPMLKEFEKTVSRSPKPQPPSASGEANKPIVEIKPKAEQKSHEKGDSAFTNTSTIKPPVSVQSNAPSKTSPFSGFSFGKTSEVTTRPFSMADSKVATPPVLGPSTTPKKPTSTMPAMFVSPDADADAISHPEDFEPAVNFKPLIELPSLVKITTGEENEDTLFSDRAQLFRFDKSTKQWKARGIGQLKILQHNTNGSARLVMRRDQVKKLCANHIISSLNELKPFPGAANSFMWAAKDFSEEELKNEMFAVKFKTAAQAEEFKKVFSSLVEKCKESPGKSQSTKPPEKTSAPVPQDDESLKEKFKPKAGSWECSACLIMNASIASKCSACCTNKPGTDEASVDQSLRDRLAPKVGSWECSTCLVMNDANIDKCCSCSTPKIGGAPSTTNSGGSLLENLLLAPSNKNPSSFSFGSKAATSNSVGLGFSFGAPTTKETTASINFGSPASSNISSSNSQAVSSTTTTGFTFGSPSKVQTATSKFGASSTTSGSLFGTSSKEQNSKTLLGAPTARPGSLFGTSSNEQNSKTLFGASIATPGFSFGSSSKEQNTSAKFGVSTTTSGTLFGSSSKEQNTSVKFGSSTTTSGTLFGSSLKEQTPKTLFEASTTTTTSSVSIHPSSTITPGESFASKTEVSSVEKDKLKSSGTGGLFAGFNLSTNTSNEVGKPFSFSNITATKPSTTTSSSGPVFNFNMPKSKTPEKGTAKSPGGKVVAASPGSDNELYEADDGDHIYFKPLLENLPEKVDHTSGEEGESEIFSNRCKLFRWVDKQWKERGIGKLRLLKNESGRTRVVMRREQIFKVCCNHQILGNMTLKPMGKSGWMWFALDFAEGESNSSGDPELLAVRFKEVRVAEDFKRLFDQSVDFLNQDEIVDDDAIIFVKSSPGVTPEQVMRARKLRLPDHFYSCEAFPEPEDLSSDEDDLLEAAVKRGLSNQDNSSTTSSSLQTTTPSIANQASFLDSIDQKHLSDFSSLAAKVDGEAPFKSSSDTSNFHWAGQGAQLFGSKLATKTDNVDDVAPSEDVDFAPVIPLPELVTIETGEEEEDCLFRTRARLYRFTDGQWKERGMGEIKVLGTKGSNIKFRLIMRRDQILKVCLNHAITADCPAFTPMSTSPKSICWYAFDYSDGEPQNGRFALRLKSPQEIDAFKLIITELQGQLKFLTNFQEQNKSDESPGFSVCAGLLSSFQDIFNNIYPSKH